MCLRVPKAGQHGPRRKGPGEGDGGGRRGGGRALGVQGGLADASVWLPPLGQRLLQKHQAVNLTGLIHKIFS